MTDPKAENAKPAPDSETLDDLRREARALGGDEVEESERMAIDNPPGTARPRYDQYALNDPESIDKPAQERAEEEE